MDPDKKYVSARICRNYCVGFKSFYIKDLKIFINRSIEKIIIVDNSSLSFCKNLDNAIPIIPFYNDK